MCCDRSLDSYQLLGGNLTLYIGTRRPGLPSARLFIRWFSPIWIIALHLASPLLCNAFCPLDPDVVHLVDTRPNAPIPTPVISFYRGPFGNPDDWATLFGWLDEDGEHRESPLVHCPGTPEDDLTTETAAFGKFQDVLNPFLFTNPTAELTTDRSIARLEFWASSNLYGSGELSIGDHGIRTGRQTDLSGQQFTQIHHDLRLRGSSLIHTWYVDSNHQLQLYGTVYKTAGDFKLIGGGDVYVHGLIDLQAGVGAPEINIDDAELILMGGNNISSNTLVKVGPNGLFHLNDTSENMEGIDGLPGGIVDLGNGGALTVNLGFFRGEIRGSGDLVKQSVDNLELLEDNTFSGNLIIEEGSVSADSSFGDNNMLSNDVDVNIHAGAVFDVDNTAEQFGGLSGDGFVLTGGSSGRILVGANGASSTFSGQIQGPGGLSKVGGGTLTLDGEQAYTGHTIIEGGTLKIVPTGGLQTLHSGTIVNVTAGTFDMSAYGTGQKQDIRLLLGDGNVVLGDGALFVVGSANGTFSGSISGPGYFHKEGSGTQTFTGNNTYSGSTVIDDGILELRDGGDLSQSALIVNSGGQLNVVDGDSEVAGLSGSGPVTLSSSTLAIVPSSSSTFSGVISGDGNLARRLSPTFTTLNLTADQTYTGQTVIEYGHLNMVNGASLSSQTDVTVHSGGAFRMSSADNTIASLSGDGDVIFTNSKLVTGSNSSLFSGQLLGGFSLIKNGPGTFSFGGTATSPTSSIEVSGGTFLLGPGGNIDVQSVTIFPFTFFPGTAFQMVAGELTTPSLIGLPFLPGAPVDFSMTGGILHADSIDFDFTQDGGILAPGTSPGITAISGSYTMGPLATLQIELGGTTSGTEHDQVIVLGPASLGGTLDVTTIDLGGGLFVPSIGDTFVVLASTSPLLQTFDQEILPATGGGLTFDWAVHYNTLDVTLELLSTEFQGDFQEDGDVDDGDLLVWEANYGTLSGASHTDGDADGDFDVDGLDYLIWQQQFGIGVVPLAGESAAVPEPSTSALVLAALCLAMSRRGSL